MDETFLLTRIAPQVGLKFALTMAEGMDPKIPGAGRSEEMST